MWEAASKIWNLIRTPLFEISGNKFSIMSLILACIVFYLSVILSRMTERFIKNLLDGKDIDPGVKDSISTFTRYLVVIIGTLITLDTVGVSLSSLAALGAVLMVGIGFGLQNITQNFIAGLIILIERPIKLGDLVEVKGVSGKVIQIGARSTLVNTRDDITIIVPNSQFIAEQVINESFSGERIRLHISVGVAYGTDTRKVETVLKEVGNAHDKVLDYPGPSVIFVSFGDSSLNFELRVWTKELWDNESLKSDIRFAIDEAFRTEKIAIPFPQRDLHIKSTEVSLHN
ncbi:MAG: small-conductance mechanosensitive channel [Bacteriovoracaceae bacterium]|jgi:small-conductance mechanosensitive channel